MIQGDVSTSDIVFGAIVLAGFLVVAYVIGKTTSAFTNRKFARAWEPLVPIVNGTVSFDSGASASSSLYGQYNGHRVHANMVPQRNKYEHSPGERFNYFDVGLKDIPGAHDWTIRHNQKVLGMGYDGWRVHSLDAAEQQRVESWGLTSVLAMLGAPQLEFDAATQTLMISNDITPNLVVTAADFKDLLDLLVRVARLQAA